MIGWVIGGRSGSVDRKSEKAWLEDPRREPHAFHVSGRFRVVVPNSCSKHYFRIDRREIHFLKFVLEGYGGLAVMRTVNPSEGLVVLHVSPGCEGDVNAILADVRKQIRIEAVSPVKEEVP